MTQIANSFRVAATTALLTLVVRPAAAEITSYVISSGGEYTYLPSPEGSGIPGGMPSDYLLNFGISGTFDVEVLEGMMGQPATLQFLNANLALTGNEAIQMNPPALTPVTGDRVADFLEARNFLNLPQGAIVFADETFPNLRVMLSNIGGHLSLFGGFDNTPADGVGMQFMVQATPVPEPAACVAAATVAILLVTAGRRNGRHLACHRGPPPTVILRSAEGSSPHSLQARLFVPLSARFYQDFLLFLAARSCSIHMYKTTSTRGPSCSNYV